MVDKSLLISTFEEVLGIIKGLAGVFKEQQIANCDLASNTQKQILELASSVKDLLLAINKKDAATIPPLRLLHLTLPEFNGKEKLDRFSEQLTNVLLSSGVSPYHWFA